MSKRETFTVSWTLEEILDLDVGGLFDDITVKQCLRALGHDLFWDHINEKFPDAASIDDIEVSFRVDGDRFIYTKTFTVEEED